MPKDNAPYTTKIVAPVYEPTEVMPELSKLLYQGRVEMQVPHLAVKATLDLGKIIKKPAPGGLDGDTSP